jgi:hypothetical protein
MTRYHRVNNKRIPFTDEENAVRDAEEAAWSAGANDRAFAALREKRDQLLHDTDWWASSDLSISEDQTSYRQKLRDLPAATADPTNPAWPVAPSKED